MNIQSIYHININCTAFDRSFEFYQRLGCRPIVGPAKGGGGAINEQVLRLPGRPAPGVSLCNWATIPIAVIST